MGEGILANFATKSVLLEAEPGNDWKRRDMRWKVWIAYEHDNHFLLNKGFGLCGVIRSDQASRLCKEDL